jgi:hypothetical protein
MMTDSWWLKFKRAQYHMVEIQRMTRLYVESQPYRLVQIPQPKNEPYVLYQLEIVAQPDPLMAIIVGEFIHCLRSALDHIVVACAPAQERKHAGFPVAYIDPFALDANGCPVNPDKDARDSFARQIAGLADGPRALVIGAQPYKTRSPAQVEQALIGILNRLENADKHRQLVLVGYGVQDARTELKMRDTIIEAPIPMTRAHFLDNGTVIELTGISELHPEVQVHLRGSAVITVKVSRLEGNQRDTDIRLRNLMLHSLPAVRNFLRAMEPFVRR